MSHFTLWSRIEETPSRYSVISVGSPIGAGHQGKCVKLSRGCLVTLYDSGTGFRELLLSSHRRKFTLGRKHLQFLPSCETVLLSNGPGCRQDSDVMIHRTADRLFRL